MSLPRLRPAALALATAAVALATGLVPAQASAPGWRIVNTIGPANGSTSVEDLVASGPGNAWSTWGSCGPCGGQNPVARTLFRHWDGSAWRQVVVPTVFAGDNLPAAFAARSSADAWAFGWDLSNHPVSARWNGSAWTVRSLPSWVLRINGAGDAVITAVVFRPTDVWVFSSGALSLPTVAAHFNGRRWRKVTLPDEPLSVSALSRHDIWAVGVVPKTVGSNSPSYVAMHWNGSSWRTVRVPKVQVPQGAFHFVGNAVAMGPRSVWMASGIQTTGPAKITLLHWNSNRWRAVKLGFPTSEFDAIAQDGHSGLRIVAEGPAPGFVRYFYHYNNGQWSRTLVPSTTGSHTQVTDITWIPGTRSMWAAGELVESSGLVGVTLKFGP